MAMGRRFSVPEAKGGQGTGWLFPLLGLLSILIFAGCAQQQYGSATYGGEGSEMSSFAPTQYYPPPGSPDDPWGPYIREAASRYNIPEQWVRAVMAQESGGEEQAVSPAGAMGLMQIMPSTYEQLQAENGLGPDPFNPHDNILAGAAYIREMYDRYGSPGFLAAYNAGPDALSSYLAGESQLPEETVNYLAAVTPNLGNAVPMSGPLANYQVANSSGAVSPPTIVSFASGCDVNAAYDPDHPCTASTADAEQAAAPAGQVVAGSCDLNSAYDPDSPCVPAASGAASASTQFASGSGSCDLDRAYDPDSPCSPTAPAAPAPPTATMAQVPQPATTAPVTLAAGGAWAIQVGAFSSEGLARTVAAGARAELPDELAAAVIEIPATAPFGGLVLYRARLANLPEKTAVHACSQLNARQLPCIVVPTPAA